MRLWICALGVVAALAVMEAPAVAGSRVDLVSANGASIPPGGVPLVQWNRNLFAMGLPPALSSSQQLLPFVGPRFMNVALAPAGNATVLAAEPVLVDAHGGTLSSGVFFGTADSTGRVRFTRVLPAGDARLPLLATSSAGDALLVWGHGHAIAIDRMAPGGRLRPPVVAGHFPVADVAIDGHGNATLLGYTSGGGRFFVSTAPRNGSFGKPTTLPFTSSIAHVSSGTAGQTIVVASHLSAPEGVQLFYRPQPDAAFGPAENIAGPSAQALVSTAVDAHGRALVAWTQFDANQRIRLHVMITDESGQPAQDSVLSAPDRNIYGFPAVTMNDEGDAAAIWEEATPGSGSTGEGPPHIYASIRPAGGDFSAAQPVTPPGRQGLLDGPAVALALDATAIVVWGDVPEGTDGEARFMTARLTSSGLSDVTRLDTGPVAPATPPATPPLLKGSLAVAKAQRVNAVTGKVLVGVGCTSWTLDPCRGQLVIRTRGNRSQIANRTVRVAPQSHATLALRLSRTVRRTLAHSRAIHAVVSVTLTGSSTRGARKSLVLRRR